MRGGPINRRWARQIGPYGCPDYFVHLHNRPLLTRKEARWNFNWDIKQLQNLATMGGGYTNDKLCAGKDILKSLLLFNSVDVFTRDIYIMLIGGNF